MAILEMIAIVGLVLQTPAAVNAQGAQGAPSAPAGQRDPSLERIRSRLAEPAQIPTPRSTLASGVSAGGRPLFQVHIDVEMMPSWDWMGTELTVPTYVRPTYTLTHHEFMASVTPDLFRGVAVHPYGVPIFSVARGVAKAARGPLRRRKEAKAKREVAEARAAFEAAATAAKAEKCSSATGCSP